MMKAEEFVAKARLADDSKTLYVLGCFGAPMNAKNKKRYSNNKEFNKKRADKINAASADTFGFDCVCLIKGILWGWDANVNAIYGGADFKANGVPDFGTESMLDYCTDVSTDFSNIEPGEVLWMEGHAGIVISDKLAIECTPIWEDGVQITAIGNVGKVKGYHTRTWKKHGKIKFVDYTKPEPVEPTPVEPEPTPVDPFPGVSDEELAARVWAGEFGNNPERKEKLGIRYDAVQALVDQGIGKPEEPKPVAKFKVGDRVKIVGTGNSNSYGTGRKAFGLGWHRYITKIYEGRAFPYQVGNKGVTDSLNTTGFYKEDALEIAN